MYIYVQSIYVNALLTAYPFSFNYGVVAFIGGRWVESGVEWGHDTYSLMRACPHVQPVTPGIGRANV